MANTNTLEIFLTTVPGLEPVLIEEVREKGFKSANLETGGVTIRGDWRDVWRANLMLRGASRILVRLGSFKVMHLAKLDKLARRFPWGETLRPDMPVRVDVTCRKSRIYHDKAAAERIEAALREEFGVKVSPEADICIKARLFNDICTISIDTSGDALHKRGYKEAVNKAPMRENIAALLLRKCGFMGNEPVIDPMCGSGTFVIEAAEIAAGVQPGRSRQFAFEKLASFDASAWEDMKQTAKKSASDISHQFWGFDRDAGAIQMSKDNARRAGIESKTNFKKQAVSDLQLPQELTDTGSGLIIANPPYGARIGDEKKLQPLYAAFGEAAKKQFPGWRVGLVTNSDTLAHATGFSFKKKKLAFSHGGIPVKLYLSKVL